MRLWRALGVVIGLGITPAARAAEPNGKPLVFIHGIKGAELVDAQGEVVWVAASQALGFSTPQLALETRFVDGKQPVDALKPHGVLAKISIIPGIFSVNVYGPFLDAALASGRPFHPFAYDWRRDNNETVKAFIAFLEDLAKKYAPQKPVVVAHSMGGLITLAVLNERPDLFDRIVFAGVPFRGGVGFLSDLTVGEATGFNDEILGRDVLATCPSVFTLFPLAHESVVDAGQKPVAVNFYEAEDWKRFRLGPYAEKTPPETYAIFLRETLSRGKAFRQRLTPKSGAVLPPILIVTSKAHKTLVKVQLGGPKSENGVDFESMAKADGDGRVAYDTSLPPSEIVPVRIMTTLNDHSELLNDPEVIGAVLKF